MNSVVGSSFKVVFAKKVLAGPVNSAWDPHTKNAPLGNVQNALPKQRFIQALYQTCYEQYFENLKFK